MNVFELSKGIKKMLNPKAFHLFFNSLVLDYCVIQCDTRLSEMVVSDVIIRHTPTVLSILASHCICYLFAIFTRVKP